MYSIVKRFFDIVFSLFGILLFFPFFLIIALLLKTTGEGYIFYLQKRIGQYCQTFDIFKFATMLKNSPNIGNGSITVHKDPRVLPMGFFLRKSKLNEIPQLINVLKGNMSFVGPRPLVQKQFGYYSQQQSSLIYKCKPGITGIGSIVFRDEEQLLKNAPIDPHQYYQQTISPYKAALELWYQQHQSFKVDMLILLFTFWIIIFPKSEFLYKIFKNLPTKNF
jgi:lipopolysaccharide/colanic/teichoic acid biosynthesis glycosyltransferase